MGIMLYSAVVLLFGMTLGAVFANVIRSCMKSVRDFVRYMKDETKQAASEPVVERID